MNYILGRAALSYLLKGAKHIQTFGDSGMFIKPGGYRAAIKDFKAVHPTHVEVVHDVRGIVSINLHRSNAVGGSDMFIKPGGYRAAFKLQGSPSYIRRGCRRCP